MKIVTDLDKFSLEQIWRPYQTMAGFDKHLEKAPFSLEATAAALREETEWSKVVLDRLRAIGIKFPPYIVHPLVDVVTGRAVEKRAPPSDMNEWRASSSIDGPSESGYYSAGIDIPFKNWRGLTAWHDHAIQVHRQDQAEAVSIRDAILAARHVAVGEHINEPSREKATEPGSESRAERLMHAMEGELEGFTCDMESAMRILAHVDAGEEPVPAARQVMEAAPAAEKPPAGWKFVPADDPQRPFCDPAIPDEMVFAGSDALDKADEDLRKGVGPDWDTGMICVAVYRAMLAAAPDAPSVASAPVPSYEDGVKEGTGSEAVLTANAEPDAWEYRTRAKGGEWNPWVGGRAPSLIWDTYEVEERPLYTRPYRSYDEGIKEWLRRALEAVRGCEFTLPLAIGIPDGASMASRQIEAAILSLLPKEGGK